MFISIHQVTSLELSEIKLIQTTGSNYKILKINSDDGETQITLFADNESQLKINEVTE